MSYESIELSRTGARPVECYRFQAGADVFLHTSADKLISIPPGIFSPEVIERTEVEHSDEDVSGALELVVALNHPVLILFAAYSPEAAVDLTVYSVHRQEPTDFRVLWAGQVSNARVEGPNGRLTCLPDASSSSQRFPARIYSSQCQWPLYGPGCEADQASKTDPVTVTTVDPGTPPSVPATITSADFALQPDEWYTNGWIKRATGEQRMIVRHVGDTVTLRVPFRALFSSEVVSAIAGCQRRYVEDCIGKFANGNNHGGYLWIPKRNPYSGRVL